MNGKTLPLDHGFPLRLVVPGWVGVANVKWVGQLEVAATPLYSAAGQYTLQARATDSTSAVQPATVPFNDAGYGFAAIVRHPVVVR